MIEFQKVLHVFSELSGLELSDAENIQSLCEISATEIERKLKPDVVTPENMERLCFAVAAVAFFKYCMVRASRESGSFKAGDVSVSQADANTAKLAKTIRDDAMDMIADLTEDGSFIFQQI